MLQQLGQLPMGWLLIALLAAIFAPLIAPHDPYRTSMARRLIAPGDARHWLGTDWLTGM